MLNNLCILTIAENKAMIWSVELMLPEALAAVRSKPVFFLLLLIRCFCVAQIIWR